MPARACPILETSPFQARMHGGASEYWFAATIENTRLRTKVVKVSSDEGNTWRLCTLTDPNLPILDGTIPDDTAWVRFTSINGDQVMVKDAVLKSNTITKATDNFP